MSGLRNKLHSIIFEAETIEGKIFDLGLIASVVISVIVVMLESVDWIYNLYAKELRMLEWFFTISFTIEYVLRLCLVTRPLRYATSFFGVVDLLSIIPTYVSVFVPGAQGMIIIRALRLFRIFRVLKLHRFTFASRILGRALLESRHKIVVFMTVVMTVVFIYGALMYLIEGKDNGFTSIPQSIYWTIVTMTTVGYGDLVPNTPLGQFLAAILMISGYGILAVPTGIVSVEIANIAKNTEFTRTCQHCSKEGHEYNAIYCSKCGSQL